MEQTFLHFVLTDLRFWASSASAILRSLLLPTVGILGGLALVGGGEAAGLGLVAAMLWAMVEWGVLILRMARRIALGEEDPNGLLDRSVVANAAYLHRSYYAG